MISDRRNITQEALLCRFCNKTLPTKRRFMCHLTGHNLSGEQCAFELSKLLCTLFSVFILIGLFVVALQFGREIWFHNN